VHRLTATIGADRVEWRRQSALLKKASFPGKRLLAPRCVTAGQRRHAWVEVRGDTVIHEPRPFPEYGEHCYATFFSDPHGVMLEVLCHAPEETDAEV
jgi:hypothetical protein